MMMEEDPWSEGDEWLLPADAAGRLDPPPPPPFEWDEDTHHALLWAAERLEPQKQAFATPGTYLARLPPHLYHGLLLGYLMEQLRPEIAVRARPSRQLEEQLRAADRDRKRHDPYLQNRHFIWHEASRMKREDLPQIGPLPGQARAL